MNENLSDIPTLLIILFILLIATAIFAGLEMAISSVNRIRIKTRAENGDIKAEKILEIISDYDRSITTVIVVNNLINIILPTLSSIIFLGIFFSNPALGLTVSTVFMSVILLIFGEIVPKIYCKEHAESVLNSTVYLIIFIKKIFFPIVIFFTYTTSLVKKLLVNKSKDNSLAVEIEDEILTIIEESSQDGTINEEEGELIRNAIEFNDIRVAEILQPKDKMVMINVTETHANIYNILCQERYSRIPIFEEREENIIGIISERDFLFRYANDEKFNIQDIAREVVFVPDTLKISRLMYKMQKEHLQMVMVVDERGTVQGLITLEDIIEELVGDIWDEHDDVVLEYHKINETTFEVIGDMNLNEFNDLFEIKDVEAETEESTIAGYILELAEKIPDLHEKFEDDHFVYTIIEVTGKKIEKILVELKEKEVTTDE
ncbi:MAG: hemolysin family protein [Mycoplasmatales bacterium]